MLTRACFTDDNVYPTAIAIREHKEVFMELAHTSCTPALPVCITVTVLPCVWEPSLPVPGARAMAPKLGRKLIEFLITRLGPRYQQMRCMNPVLAASFDDARREQSLTGALLCLLSIDAVLFSQLTHLICQAIRKDLASPGRDFYPNGSLYCCWLVGRLLLVQDLKSAHINSNARNLATRIRTWVLGTKDMLSTISNIHSSETCEQHINS